MYLYNLLNNKIIKTHLYVFIQSGDRGPEGAMKIGLPLPGPTT